MFTNAAHNPGGHGGELVEWEADRYDPLAWDDSRTGRIWFRNSQVRTVGASVWIDAEEYEVGIVIVDNELSWNALDCIERHTHRPFTGNRSEERRVGKECRSRWSAYHLKKKNM